MPPPAAASDEVEEVLLLHVSATLLQGAAGSGKVPPSAFPQAPTPVPAAAPVALAAAPTMDAAHKNEKRAGRGLWIEMQAQRHRAAQRSSVGVLEVTVVVLLALMVVLIALLVHNNWDVQAAVDESRAIATKAAQGAKKATHKAAATMERITRVREEVPEQKRSDTLSSWDTSPATPAAGTAGPPEGGAPNPFGSQPLPPAPAADGTLAGRPQSSPAAVWQLPAKVPNCC